MKTRRNSTRRGSKKRASTRVRRMRGGAKQFNIRTFLGAGAAGATFITTDNTVVKVIKAGAAAGMREFENEQYILTKLSELELPYFPSFIEAGQGVSEAPINFTENSMRATYGPGRPLFNRTGPHTYNYLVMSLAEGSKQFPVYLRDKIKGIIPGLDRRLTSDELDTIVNHILTILAKLAFAFYVADKVFNFRHVDFNERNCVIKANGDPVIVDFGSGKMLNNVTRSRANNSAHNLRGYLGMITSGLYYKDTLEPLKPYVEQIKEHPSIAALLNIQSSPHMGIMTSITRITSKLEYLMTGANQGGFDYERTFRNLGISQDLITRAAEKIRTREARAPPAANANTNNALETLRRSLAMLGMVKTNDEMRAAIRTYPDSVNQQVSSLF